MDPTPSAGATSGAPLQSCIVAGPRVPPRRNGSRMKKAAAPLSPRVATAGSCSSFSGSGVSPEVASVVTSQPMGGDDCAINDLLEGRTDLCLVLPDNRQVFVNVERRTPVMDLLVQVATTNKINPSGHVIQVASNKGYEAVCKPNTPVGSLDVKELFIVPKTSSVSSDFPRKRTARRAVQPFEPTFRLQVRLPRNQLAVLRVTLGTTLGWVKKTVCEEKGLDPQGYQLVALGRPPVARLDPALTLEQFGAAEVGLMSNQALAASIQNSATDLISYSITKESKKGIIGVLTHHRSKGSLTGSSSDGVSSRGTSPARSDPLAPVSAATPQIVPTAPCRAPTKKRPAPPPPVQSQMSNRESEGNGAVAGVSGEQGVTRTHSRQSSDSSGYHEASVLSDFPETPSPETVCESSGMGSVDTPPQSLEVARPRRDKGPSKPRPTSLASDTSLGHGKKRRAPPPPVLEASASPSTSSVAGNVCNGGTTSVPTLPTHSEVKEDRSAGCPEEDADPKASTDEGLYENSEIPRESGERCQERDEITGCPPCPGSESSAVTAGPDPILLHTSTQDEAMTQEEIMLHIDASFSTIEEDTTKGTSTTMSWDYNMPEPPSPFRSTAPLGLTAEDFTLAEVTEAADVVCDGTHEFDDSSLVDSGHIENFNDDKGGSFESAELAKEDEALRSADTCSMAEAVCHLSLERGEPVDNKNSSQPNASHISGCHHESLCSENVVKAETIAISSRTGSNGFSFPLEEAGPEISAEQEQAKHGTTEHCPTSSESLLNKVQDIGSATKTTVAVNELCKEQSGKREAEVTGPTACAQAGENADACSAVSALTEESLPKGADALPSKSHYEHSDTLTRSRSMKGGPVSFSIGSYGSYKTEMVDDIFSDEPGRVEYDRFRNIKVACSPSTRNVVQKNKEVAVPENSSEISAPVTEPSDATERKGEAEYRPSIKSGFTVTIGEKLNDKMSSMNSSSGEKSLVARSSSMLDLRESAAAGPKRTKSGDHPGTGKTCLADEKETLLNEYAKLQLQFVAWQQQLATNQNLLENKNIVPSIASTTSQPSLRTERESCSVLRRNAESGSTLPKSKAYRPTSLFGEANRASFPIASVPKVQLGSWTERHDNLQAGMEFRDKTYGTSEFTSTKPSLFKKQGAVSEHVVVQLRKEADTQVTRGISKQQPRPRTSLPASKSDSRPVSKKPTGLLYSAPTVRGFSQEAVSKIIGEMMLAKKEDQCINGKATKPISSSQDTDKVATQDVSSQEETSPVKEFLRKPLIPIVTELQEPIAKGVTMEESRIHNQPVISPNEGEEKIVDQCPSGLHSETAQSVSVSIANLDANKPSIVQATLKTGVTMTAVVPPPPPPPVLQNGLRETPKKMPNSRARSAISAPLPRDPREVLMDEIRSFGGKSSLKKVSTEPAWQLNICNIRSAPA